jgi:hypothetical protein
MRRFLVSLFLLAGTLVSTAARQAPQREIDNVAAFARLYGVLRYFYPSDSAAALDWNRFAVHGVAQVRPARDTGALEATLKALVAPLGPGIVVARTLPQPAAAGGADATLVAWRYLGAGIGGPSPTGPYRAKRTNRPLPLGDRIDGFATMMQTVPALPLRGKPIRLRALVRAEASAGDPASSVALWLRVDRPNREMGFFDNMGDRPIRVPEWREYVIEGTVADDATAVMFGAMAAGTATAEFESFRLEVRDVAGAWSPLDIADPGFEDSAAGPGGWIRAGTSRTAIVSRPSDKAPEGRQFLRIVIAPGVASDGELFEAPLNAGSSVDIDLGSGLHARVPLTLSDPDAKAGATRLEPLEALRQAVASVPVTSDAVGVDARLADVTVAWSVFRHFYPYFEEAVVDWNERLVPQMTRAYEATTRDGQREALRLLVADLRDGHGGVVDVQRGPSQGALQIQLQVVEGRIVIVASDVADAPVGAVVASIGGVPAERRVADAARLSSGSPQWKERRALLEIITCQPGSSVPIAIDTPTGPRSVSVTCEGKPPVVEKRPSALAEVAPGIRYVDLTRATMAQITPALPELSAATGIVFDLRGYPTDAGNGILPYLLTTAETDRWMHVNRIVGPYGQSAGWQDMGWNRQPASPHLGGRIVFLTDGRAISYAESVMGYVADRKLGTIVGGATAGANGNVAALIVPTGFRLTFTGMRVTRHDGTTPHHLAGIKPDVPLAPTLSGIRAGRDELLERGIAIARGQ